MRGSQKVRTLAAVAAAPLALFAAFLAPPPARADVQQFILDKDSPRDDQRNKSNEALDSRDLDITFPLGSTDPKDGAIKWPDDPTDGRSHLSVSPGIRN